MNEFFKKLNIKFDIENLSMTTEDKKLVDQYVTWQKYGASLAKKQKFIPTHATGHYADDEAKIKILKQLPKAVLDLEMPIIGILELSPKESDQNGTPIVFPPHIDPDRITCINIYENINGEETSFYESIKKQQEITTKGIQDEYDAKLALLRQYYANGAPASRYRCHVRHFLNHQAC